MSIIFFSKRRAAAGHTDRDELDYDGQHEDSLVEREDSTVHPTV